MEMLKTLQFNILFFYRHVDDITIPSSIEQVLLNKFNSYHLRLQFMLEIYNNSIKFLDMMILNNKIIFD